MRAGPLKWTWLGSVPYAEAHRRQLERRAAIQKQGATEEIWLLEHPAVVTTGRRPAPGTPDRQTLAALGVESFRTERGGLATFHGPGQLVTYLLIDIGARNIKVRTLVRTIEQDIIDWLSSQGVPAHRRSGAPGVWSGTLKLAALGLHISRGVTMHGAALNLHTDLSGFSLIVPCGITDGGVTSLAALTGTAPSPQEAAFQLGPALATAIENITIN